GGEVGGPVFKRIAEQVLAYRDEPHDVPAPSDVEMAKNLEAMPRPDARSGSESGAAQARFQAAVASTNLPSSASALPTVAFGDPSAVVVPSLTGRTVRGVTEECSRLGLMPSLIGSGVALEQFPAAGAQVLHGSRVTVRFGRPGEIVPVSAPGDGN
ncbi:MAG TPA: PASTA domain-containing protein, partial [Candidatus Cybelea sp.]|nr:PASTA domain-containing protein [Candidatus Cybelea sp.]